MYMKNTTIRMPILSVLKALFDTLLPVFRKSLSKKLEIMAREALKR